MVKNNNVDNKKLYSEMIKYVELVRYAKSNNLEKPRVSEYIGKCILQIASKLAMMPRFMRYPFKDEMIFDGIENCLKYIDNYDPDNYNNPHAYFSKVIYWAFVRRIKSEHKQSYIKHKVGEKLLVENGLYGLQYNDERVLEISITSDERVNDFIKSYEETLTKSNHRSNSWVPKKRKKKEKEQNNEQ